MPSSGSGSGGGATSGGGGIGTNGGSNGNGMTGRNGITERRGTSGRTKRKSQRNNHRQFGTMPSALDTLLEAARFIELQEQQRLTLSPSPPTTSNMSSSSSSLNSNGSGGGGVGLGVVGGVGGSRYHHHHYNNTNNNINNSNSNNNNSTNNINSNTSSNGNGNGNGNGNIVSIGIGGNTTASTTSSRNNTRHHFHHHHQVSSPPISPVFATSNDVGNVGSGGHLGTTGTNSNLRDFTEYGPTLLAAASSSSNNIRASDGHSNGANSGHHGNGITTLGGTTTVIHNGNTVHHNVLAAATEDSSQSSLNLSSSGYLSGSSANSSVGGGSNGVSNLNMSTSPATPNSILNGGNNDHHQHHIQIQTQTTGRRRTTSTNSNGGTQRSPCILRAGTREVHNKLEKHRRAHLKECFEQLKVQLQLRHEEKKKTSNLAILGAAYRHVMSLKRKERELEQQVEQLAKEKINAQKKILTLRRELSAKYDNIDLTNIVTDADIANIPGERDSLSDSVSLSSGRGSTRYSSSSSLSSGATVSSPLGASMQTAIPTTMSPVLSSVQSPNSPHLKSSSPIGGSSMPLSLTAKNFPSTAIGVVHQRGSPTPSILSLSASSSGISSSSPMVSSSCSSSSSSSSSPSSTSSTSSPGISSVGIKIPNVPNGIKLSPNVAVPSPNLTLVSSATNNINNSNNINFNNNFLSSSSPTSLTTSSLPVINLSTISESNGISPTFLTTTSSGIPLNINTSQNVKIFNSTSTPKDMSVKNGVCRKTSLSEGHDCSTLGSMVLTTNVANIGSKEIKVDKIFDESEQPTKVIKLFNGIALAPVDKDSKLLSSTSLALSQVVGGGGGLVVSPFPMLTTSSQGLRVIGTNGLATIELSTPTVQSRNQQQSISPPVTSITPTTGAQLHKLLVSGCTTATGVTTGNVAGGVVTSPITHVSSVASELARLPGGAELNILPTGANGTTTLYRGNGKLAIVNNGIAVKGTDGGSATGRAVHVVTPLQSGGAPISGLTPIVVSQGHIIASTPQLAGKVNLSVGGQALPLISTQYLSSMKPMVVAVASNTTPTLSSVPPTPTSAAVPTLSANASAS